MIVGIIKTGTGLVALEEFRKADSEALAVSELSIRSAMASGSE